MDNNKEKYNIEAVFDVDDYLYFYDELLDNERTKIETDFLIKELELVNYKKILDLACGHGRHSNMLANIGYDVTGVDISQGFIDIAREEAKKKNLSINYIKKDIRKISFDNEFSQVLLLFTAFGYFSDEENIRVIENIAKALKKGGLFCFDLFNRDIFLKNFIPYMVMEKENNLMIDRNSFDPITGRLYDDRIVIKDGLRKDKPYFIRLYNYSEINKILHNIGFEIYKIFGSWFSKPFQFNSSRMIIIARKER